MSGRHLKEKVTAQFLEYRCRIGQRTPCAMLFTRSRATISFVRRARAFTLPLQVIRGVVRFTEDIRFPRRSATGWSKGQCDGTETCNRTALLAPRRRASSNARSIPSFEPAITIWRGALMFPTKTGFSTEVTACTIFLTSGSFSPTIGGETLAAHRDFGLIL